MSVKYVWVATPSYVRINIRHEKPSDVLLRVVKMLRWLGRSPHGWVPQR